MSYTGNAQTTVSATQPKAIEGMRGDCGFSDTISCLLVTAATDAGRIVCKTAYRKARPPSTSAEITDHAAGLTLYEPIAEPNTAAARFAVGEDVNVLRVGRGWAAVKTGTIAHDDPVYVYHGATTADRGKVSNVAAADYTLLPGARFTGRKESTTLAEIQLGDAQAYASGSGGPEYQFVTGVMAAGTVTVAAGIRITAASRVVPVVQAAIGTSTNFACLQNIPGNNVVGEDGVGAVTINAITSAGVLDSDATCASIGIHIWN